jgi:photosystem II stability/assembly factor-like uncharacterized protein
MGRWSFLIGLLGAMTACALAPSPSTEKPGAELRYSRDGGKNWRTIVIPFQGFHRTSFASIWGFDRGPLFLTGTFDGSTHYIFRLDVERGDWTRELTSNRDINALWGSSVSELYAVDDLGRVLHRAGPSDWKTLQTIPSQLLSIWGSSADRIFIGSTDGVWRSTDRGATWSAVWQSRGSRLRSLWGSSASDVYAVGTSGLIVHSSDGGESWSVHHWEQPLELNGVNGSGANDVYVVGDEGLILHSADRGVSWQKQASGTSQPLDAIYGLSESLVVAAGLDGIQRTTDKGRSWHRVLDNPHYYRTAIWGSKKAGLTVAGAYIIEHFHYNIH